MTLVKSLYTIILLILVDIVKFTSISQCNNKIETSDPYHQAEEAEFLKELGNQKNTKS